MIARPSTRDTSVLVRPALSMTYSVRERVVRGRRGQMTGRSDALRANATFADEGKNAHYAGHINGQHLAMCTHQYHASGLMAA